MINFTKDELSTFSLQQLADLFPESPEQEKLQKEMFDLRAAHSSYEQLVAVDIKGAWQEKIIQKYVDIKRETMALENAAVLSPEEEALLEPGVVTKETEIALQKKLDERNAKKRGKKVPEDEVAILSDEPEQIVVAEHKEEKKVKAKK